jgi:recombination protein RecT
MSNNELLIDFAKQISNYEKMVFPFLLNEHKDVSPAKFKHICMNEIKKNQGLQQAFMQSPMSLFASILFCAEIGLSPDGNIGEVFLIPYNNNESKKKEVKPIIGYHGIVKILLRNPKINTLETGCVFEGDKFDYQLGLEPKLNHIPNHDVDRKSVNFKYAYAICKLNGGDKIFRVMSKKEIESVRDMAKNVNYLFFNDEKDPNFWMPQKTILKQLSKLLPKDFYGSKAIQYDNHFEGGGSLTLDNDNSYKLVENNTTTKPSRYRDIYGTLGDILKP